MPKYKLTKKAVEDITNIWNYTFDKWSEKQADTYYEILIKNCQNIADDPNIGKKYNGVNVELLGLKVNRHIIFYRPLSDQTIEITRILHGRIDLKTRSNES